MNSRPKRRRIYYIEKEQAPKTFPRQIIQEEPSLESRSHEIASQSRSIPFNARLEALPAKPKTLLAPYNRVNRSNRPEPLNINNEYEKETDDFWFHSQAVRRGSEKYDYSKSFNLLEKSEMDGSVRSGVHQQQQHFQNVEIYSGAPGGVGRESSEPFRYAQHHPFDLGGVGEVILRVNRESVLTAQRKEPPVKIMQKTGDLEDSIPEPVLTIQKEHTLINSPEIELDSIKSIVEPEVPNQDVKESKFPSDFRLTHTSHIPESELKLTENNSKPSDKNRVTSSLKPVEPRAISSMLQPTKIKKGNSLNIEVKKEQIQREKPHTEEILVQKKSPGLFNKPSATKKKRTSKGNNILSRMGTIKTNIGVSNAKSPEDRIEKQIKLATGQVPMCCYTPRYKYHHFLSDKYLKIDVYGIGVGLFFRYIKSAIFVLIICFLISFLATSEYEFFSGDSGSKFPDPYGHSGKYKRFNFNSFFDHGLINVGNIGAHKYSFFEAPLHNLSTTLKIKHDQEFDFNAESGSSWFRYGIAPIETATGLTFMEFEKGCNDEGVAKAQVLASCDKKKECEVNVTSAWFKSTCLTSMKNHKMYFKFKGEDGKKIAFIYRVDEASFNTYYSAVCGVLFMMFVIQPKILNLFERISIKFKQTHNPEPRDFALQIHNFPKNMRETELRTKLLGHLIAKPEHGEVSSKLRTARDHALATERMELDVEGSSPKKSTKEKVNPILDYGKIINVITSTKFEMYHNRSLSTKYENQIQQLYKSLKDAVYRDSGVELPEEYEKVEVEEKVFIRYPQEKSEPRILLKNIIKADIEKNAAEANFKNSEFSWAKFSDSGTAFVTFETIFMRDQFLKQLKNKESRIFQGKQLNVSIPGNPVDLNWKSYFSSSTYKRKCKRRLLGGFYTFLLILVPIFLVTIGMLLWRWLDIFLVRDICRVDKTRDQAITDYQDGNINHFMQCYCRQNIGAVLGALTKDALHDTCNDEYQRFLLRESWDNIIKAIILAVIFVFLMDASLKFIRKRINREIFSEINKVHASLISRYTLIRLSYRLSLFCFIFFLDYRRSYNGFLDLVLTQNFTPARWDLIHISIRKTVLIILLEKGIREFILFCYNRHNPVKMYRSMVGFYKTKFDQAFSQNEFNISDAYSTIIEVLLLTAVFGAAIPELILICVLYLFAKYFYFKYSFLKRSWKTITFNEITHQVATKAWYWIAFIYLILGHIQLSNDRLLSEALTSKSKASNSSKYTIGYFGPKQIVSIFKLEFYFWNSLVFISSSIILWIIAYLFYRCYLNNRKLQREVNQKTQMMKFQNHIDQSDIQDDLFVHRDLLIRRENAVGGGAPNGGSGPGSRFFHSERKQPARMGSSIDLKMSSGISHRSKFDSQIFHQAYADLINRMNNNRLDAYEDLEDNEEAARSLKFKTVCFYDIRFSADCRNHYIDSSFSVNDFFVSDKVGNILNQIKDDEDLSNDNDEKYVQEGRGSGENEPKFESQTEN